MTAASARPLALVPASSSQPAGDRVERVRELLRPEFLSEVWQATARCSHHPATTRFSGSANAQ